MNIKSEVCVCAHHVPACVCREERECKQTERQKQSRSGKRKGDLEIDGLAAFTTAVGSRSLPDSHT